MLFGKNSKPFYNNTLVRFLFLWDKKTAINYLNLLRLNKHTRAVNRSGAMSFYKFFL